MADDSPESEAKLARQDVPHDGQLEEPLRELPVKGAPTGPLPTTISGAPIGPEHFPDDVASIPENAEISARVQEKAREKVERRPANRRRLTIGSAVAAVALVVSAGVYFITRGSGDSSSNRALSDPSEQTIPEPSNETSPQNSVPETSPTTLPIDPETQQPLAELPSDLVLPTSNDPATLGQQFVDLWENAHNKATSTDPSVPDTTGMPYLQFLGQGVENTEFGQEMLATMARDARNRQKDPSYHHENSTPTVVGTPTFSPDGQLQTFTLAWDDAETYRNGQAVTHYPVTKTFTVDTLAKYIYQNGQVTQDTLKLPAHIE